jgi:hypothetical protein
MTIRFSHVMSTIMICRLVLNLQGYRATGYPKPLEMTLSDERAPTESGVLTTQFQFQSQGGSALDVWPPEDVSLQTTRTWLGSLSDRLTNERWGTAGLVDDEQRAGERNEGMVDWGDERGIEMLPAR